MRIDVVAYLLFAACSVFVACSPEDDASESSTMDAALDGGLNDATSALPGDAAPGIDSTQPSLDARASSDSATSDGNREDARVPLPTLPEQARGTLAVFAGISSIPVDGVGTSARLGSAAAFAIDPNSEAAMFVDETYRASNRRYAVRTFQLATSHVTTLVEDLATPAPFSMIAKLTFASGRLFALWWSPSVTSISELSTSGTIVSDVALALPEPSTSPNRCFVGGPNSKHVYFGINTEDHPFDLPRLFR